MAQLCPCLFMFFLHWRFVSSYYYMYITNYLKWGNWESYSWIIDYTLKLSSKVLMSLSTVDMLQNVKKKMFPMLKFLFKLSRTTKLKMEENQSMFQSFCLSKLWTNLIGIGYCPEGVWTITTYCPEPLSDNNFLLSGTPLKCP